MIGMDADEGAFLRAVRAGVSGYLLNEYLRMCPAKRNGRVLFLPEQLEPKLHLARRS